MTCRSDSTPPDRPREGSERTAYPPDLSVPRMMDRTGADHEWHMRINEYEAPHGGPRTDRGFDPASDGKSFLYEAKTVAVEVPRLAYWFARERLGELPTSHRQCSHSPSEPIPDNHLTCCLGVECRTCPHLAVIDRVEKATPEQRDAMKAWTCATHILMRGGDTAREGYVLTTDDQMYWRNLYDSLAGGSDDAHP